MNKFEFTLEKDGFYGKLFHPQENKYKDYAVIAFTGSDGNFRMACKYAQYYQNLGMAALALAYWKQKGLPSVFKSVPIESLENAINYLKSAGYKKVIVTGVSKGGRTVFAGRLFVKRN